MQYFRFLVLFFSFVSSLVFAKNPVVYYEPKSCTLRGMIKMLKFPGPPNYESIKNGDTDETGPYLILNEPVDIKLISKIKIGNDVPVKDIKLIQLVIEKDADWAKVKEGNYVDITGNLFGAITGHHHARVLIKIKSIQIIGYRRIIENKLDITKKDKEFLQYQHLQK
jgi:hypothetical protein